MRDIIGTDYYGNYVSFNVGEIVQHFHWDKWNDAEISKIITEHSVSIKTNWEYWQKISDWCLIWHTSYGMIRKKWGEIISIKL